MPVKALMEVSSGLAWATQQDLEETQTEADRTEGSRWGWGSHDNSGKAGVWDRGRPGDLETALSPSSHPTLRA